MRDAQSPGPTLEEIKPMRTEARNGLVAALVLCLPVTGSAAASVPRTDLHKPSSQTLQGGGDGIAVRERLTTAPGIASPTLTSARTLYAKLLTARQAAQAQNRLDTRMALDSAGRAMDALYGPADMATLMHESATIRADLRDTTHEPKAALWLPLQATLAHIRDTVPADRLNRARAAVDGGASAASQGDRHAAAAALDRLESTVGYRFALLPIRRVRGDLASANAAMLTDPPRWQGVTEALDSALSSVRWVTTEHARGWLSAYDHAADAIDKLADQPAEVRRDLNAIATDLSGWPQGRPVVDQARQLARAERIDEAQVFALLDRIRHQIPGMPQV